MQIFYSKHVISNLMVFAALSLLAISAQARQAKPSASTVFADSSTAPLMEKVSEVTTDSFGTTTALTYLGEQNDVVPAILVVPASASAASPAPCVMLIHGIGGSKEQMQPIARLLSQVGYATLSIDLPGYGSRIGENRSSFQSSDDFARYTAAGFTRAVTDLRRGMDLLAAERDIDSARVGELGVSLGSFIGVDFAAADSRVKAVALIASGGGLAAILGNQAKLGTSYGGTESALMEQLSKSKTAQNTLTTIDPITYVSQIAPRPLLMQNGGADPVVPITSAQALYKAAGEPKHIDVYPNEGHIPSPLEMYVPLTQFLAQNLAASPIATTAKPH